MEITIPILQAKRQECAEAVRQHSDLAAANAGAMQVLDELLAVARAPEPPDSKKKEK